MLQEISRDKLLHFIVGFLIGVLTNIWLVIIVGFGKEFYDYLNPENHSVELMDFIATVLGGLFSILVLRIIEVFI